LLITLSDIINSDRIIDVRPFSLTAATLPEKEMSQSVPGFNI
jgi:hypothetical protein